MTAGEAATTAKPRRRRRSLAAGVDNLFFFIGAVAAGWLAYLVLSQSFSQGFQFIWFLLVFWALLAYLLLPRIHRMLTLIYVPDYFIGRARTNEGLLGDPVNLSLFGSEAQMHTAMIEAGWNRADEVGFRSALRIITSTLFRRSYSDAPVSPLYLFGNIQDFTYQQEVAGNPAKRHHVRFWKTPEGWLLPGGHSADWLAAGTYDRDVGLSLFTLQVTHKIERETDRERDHIVQTLEAANAEVSVSVIQNFSTGYHAVNGGGDAITTDGDMPFIDLRAVTVTPAGAAGAREVGAALVSDATISSEAVIRAARDTGASNRVKRPISIYVGYLLMVARGIVGVGSVIAVFTSWADSIQAVAVELPTGSEVDTSQLADFALWAIVAFSASGLLGYLLLAQLVFWGFNWARFLVMSLSLIAALTVAIDYFSTRVNITLATDLINLSFDILVLFALSSSDARAFSRQRRQRRAERRAASRRSALRVGAIDLGAVGAAGSAAVAGASGSAGAAGSAAVVGASGSAAVAGASGSSGAAGVTR